jgi:CRP-like cAMP-binding protein
MKIIREQANTVFYIQEGAVKLSVLSSIGKEAVVAMLGPGDSSARGAWLGSHCAFRQQPPAYRATSCASRNSK